MKCARHILLRSVPLHYYGVPWRIGGRTDGGRAGKRGEGVLRDHRKCAKSATRAPLTLHVPGVLVAALIAVKELRLVSGQQGPHRDSSRIFRLPALFCSLVELSYAPGSQQLATR